MRQSLFLVSVYCSSTLSTGRTLSNVERRDFWCPCKRYQPPSISHFDIRTQNQHHKCFDWYLEEAGSLLLWLSLHIPYFFVFVHSCLFTYVNSDVTSKLRFWPCFAEAQIDFFTSLRPYIMNLTLNVYISKRNPEFAKTSCFFSFCRLFV